MSTCVVVALLLVPLGCVDPAKDYNDFNQRVIDARILPDRAPVTIADISGWHLFAINPKSLVPGKYLSYLAEVEMQIDGANATVTRLALYPLDFETLEHVDPPVPPSEFLDLVADATVGSFTVPLDEVVIPGRTNSILPGSDVTVNGRLEAYTIDEDFFCGDVFGTVVLTGSSLDGSTFAAQRIDPAQIGPTLPPVAGACDERLDTMMPDAGVPDAPVMDAGVPDAALPDAAL